MKPSLKIYQKVLLYGQVKALDCSNGYWRYGIEVEHLDQNPQRDYTDKLVWVTDTYEQGGKFKSNGKEVKSNE